MPRTLSVLLLVSALFALSPGALANSTAFATATPCSNQSIQALQSAGSNGPADGCSQADLGINNFSTPSNTGTVTPTGADVQVSSAGGVITGSTITSTFFNIQSSVFEVASGTDTLDTVIDFTVFTIPGQSDPPESGNTWAITGLGLAGSFGGSAGITGTDKLEFCLGDASFDCTRTSSNYGYFEAFFTGPSTITRMVCPPKAGGCVAKSASTNLVTFGQGSTQIGFQQTVTLAFAGATRPGTAAIGVLLNQTDEGAQPASAPEPVSCAMAALGLAVLAWRKREGRGDAQGKIGGRSAMREVGSRGARPESVHENPLPAISEG